jgi:hypothetical protein
MLKNMCSYATKILKIYKMKINLLVLCREIIPLYYNNQNKPPIYSVKICQDIILKRKTHLSLVITVY